ncbi:SH3 domain-containing protein [Parapedobacter koreensis]|uniref:Right handed beta helix region n=1 Tax=Parapedobacter koreensis TaxID=332977 RepID=A0A1H7T6L6_9SPHI|nr:hypothetical protein [Parapedobacter koreensis]SEL80542.1 hypothetical protein SAMN05421740_110125 [Parapedobacter koreensis]
MIKQLFLSLILVVYIAALNGQSVQSASSVISIGRNGKIASKNWAANGEKEAINIVPDYSYAGYKGGGVAIPDVPVKITLSPGKGDQTKIIQNAIDKISKLPLDKNGFRGKVLLRKGTYNINGTLSIRNEGVVLAGEGQGENGTVLKATKKSKQTLISIGGNSKISPISNTEQNIIDDFVGVGASSFSIQSAKGLKLGDTILIEKTPNAAWFKVIGMTQYGWTPTAYRIKHERIITGINGNELSLNIPVVDAIYKKYGSGIVYKANITRVVANCGVESLRLISDYASETDENHGWEAVKIGGAEHCWIRKITAQYFGQSCVTILNGASFITVEDCAMLDPKSRAVGGNRYSFNIVNGSFNLIQRCYTRSGRHDFVTGSRVAGPNVFLDCYAENGRADTGPHQRWATGILFDNVFANSIRVINAKSNGTGHGWTGAQIMLWNCEGNKLEVQIPPTAMNWNINTNSAIAESNTLFGKIINVVFNSATQQPRSLYVKQLEDRLGATAVNNVTTPEQRRGNLFNILKQWKGG